MCDCVRVPSAADIRWCYFPTARCFRACDRNQTNEKCKHKGEYVDMRRHIAHNIGLDDDYVDGAADSSVLSF